MKYNKRISKKKAKNSYQRKKRNAKIKARGKR